MHFQINVSGTRESAFLPVRAHTCCTVLLFVCSYNAFSMTTDALTGFNLSWTNLFTLAKFLGKGWWESLVCGYSYLWMFLFKTGGRSSCSTASLNLAASSAFFFTFSIGCDGTFNSIDNSRKVVVCVSYRKTIEQGIGCSKYVPPLDNY